MYCTVYMFTDCICLVLLTKWMTKKEKEFWCAIWKFALASLFMFSFSVLLRKKKCRLYSKAVLTQHSLPIPAQPSSELWNPPQEPGGQSLAGLAQGEESGRSLSIASDHLSTKHSVFILACQITFWHSWGGAMWPAALPTVKGVHLCPPPPLGLGAYFLA